MRLAAKHKTGYPSSPPPPPLSLSLSLLFTCLLIGQLLYLALFDCSLFFLPTGCFLYLYCLFTSLPLGCHCFSVLPLLSNVLPAVKEHVSACVCSYSPPPPPPPLLSLSPRSVCPSVCLPACLSVCLSVRFCLPPPSPSLSSFPPPPPPTFLYSIPPSPCVLCPLLGLFVCLFFVFVFFLLFFVVVLFSLLVIFPIGFLILHVRVLSVCNIVLIFGFFTPRTGFKCMSYYISCVYPQ